VSAGAPLPAQQALAAAATQAEHLTSATETISVQVTGTQNASTTGTVQFRRKPTLVLAENLTVTAAGKSTQIKAIITDTALYVNEPSLASQIGEPWIKVDLAALQTPALASLAQLVQSMQSNNFLDMTELFAASSDVRNVGTTTIDGVPTIEYAGSFQAAQLAKALAPSVQKALGPALQALGNSTVDFDIWVDGQGNPRKVSEVATLNSTTITTTVTITGINQPVQITLPPTSQTYTPPGS
jgi:hypothetical protein